ncbi:MAG: ABC transporter ATP-binding protein [Clostridiaceae bacterium]|nr:ABC transporter ATP-binding protein [Clostridiaceae bacterium]
MIRRYLRPFYKRMAVGATIKMFGTLFELVMPAILAYIINNLVPLKVMQPIFIWGGIMILASLGAWGANIIANRMASWVAANAVKNIRSDLFTRIMALSARQIDKHTIPSLESRLTTDSYNVHRFIGSIQRIGIRAPMLFIGGIIFCLIMEWRLAMILIVLLPPIAWVTIHISRKSFPLFSSLQRAIDQMVRVVRENISGIKVSKSLDKTEYEKERYAKVNQEVAARERTATFHMSITNPTINLILNTGLTLVIIVGASMVKGGLTQPGTIIAFLSYFIQITNSLLSLNSIFVIYNRASASSERIDEILTQPLAEEQKVLPPFADENRPADQAAPKPAADCPAPHIVFDHVSFAYTDQKLILKDISFTLQHGETLGIIGATGSGKSTIIQLLLRLYERSSGTILIDGRPIETIPVDALHQMFGIVFQNDFLYGDSLANNIDFGRGLPMDKLQKAVQDAQAVHFIHEKENGLEYRLTSKATNLSGGQKQRILLARALAGSPKILVLDDASSALDFRTDARLRRALAEHYADTTTIIVGQRVSSIMQAKHILVLDNGRTLGYGNHAELLANCAVYREISEQQMGSVPTAGRPTPEGRPQTKRPMPPPAEFSDKGASTYAARS